MKAYYRFPFSVDHPEWYREAQEQDTGKVRQHRYIRQCICGDWFTHDRINTRYCSDACKQRAYRIRAGHAPNRQEAIETGQDQTVTRYCAHCDQPFTRNGLSRAKYCSNACKQEAYRQRKAKRDNNPENWQCSHCGSRNMHKILSWGSWKLKCQSCGKLT